MAINLDKNPWPDWEPVRRIGMGSFGAVYEIRRDKYGKEERAALKVISIPRNDSEVQDLYSDGYDDESVTSTFDAHKQKVVEEYYLMRQMNGSSNVVHCDDVCCIQHDNGVGWDIFIKMELLTPLREMLPQEIPEETVIHLAKDMCAALELCRKYKIIHRDIKPQNILYSNNGDFKLGDFGVAKTVERTMSGTVAGSYKYMSPEVYHNQPYGIGADIYSLGMVMYWMLNERRLPFLPLPPQKVTTAMVEEGKDRRFAGEQLPPPAHGSEELKAIVLKACAYDPEDRFATAKEMLDALNGRQPVSEPAAEPKKVMQSIILDEPEDRTVVDPEPSGPIVLDTGDGQDLTEEMDDPTVLDIGKKDRKKSGEQPDAEGQGQESKQTQTRKKRWPIVLAAVVLLAVGVLFVLRPWVGWRSVDGKMYYYTSGGDMLTGWAALDGETYYFSNEGVLQTGWQTIGGERYYFDRNGAMQTGWVTFEEEKCYFGENGTMQVRLVTNNGKTCCYNQRGLMQIGWKTLGDSRYYFGSDGSMQIGWADIDGHRYYFDGNGAMVTNWTTNAAGERFNFGSDGIMQTGWVTIDGNKYYFHSNGVMQTGWTATSTGEKYYFGNDGILRTGWQTINGEKFYFDENGVLQD